MCTIFLSVRHRQNITFIPDDLQLAWRFRTDRKIRINFLDGALADIFLFPCRASPDGYSLAVHRQGNWIQIFLMVFSISLMVSAPSGNFNFPVVDYNLRNQSFFVARTFRTFFLLVPCPPPLPCHFASHNLLLIKPAVTKKKPWWNQNITVNIGMLYITPSIERYLLGWSSLRSVTKFWSKSWQCQLL